MKIIDELMDNNLSLPTAIFELANGTLVISSFKENIKDSLDDNILLVHPMIISETEDGNRTGFSLEPYLNRQIVNNVGFFVNRNSIFSIHRPTDGFCHFYISQLQLQVMNDNPFKPNKQHTKGKTSSNTIANIIHPNFKLKKDNIFHKENPTDTGPEKPEPEPPAA